jgi:hypothetical protein
VKESVLTLRWTIFTLAALFCAYDCFYGIVYMGLCPGLGCLPHTFAWILAMPCLLLAIWSLRATAVAMVAILAVHVLMQVKQEGLSMYTLWGNDKGLDAAFWVAVLFVTVAALIPAKTSDSAKTSSNDSL